MQTRELMSLLSPRALAELTGLQATVRELASTRAAALRVLSASRNVAARSAQQEVWLEFCARDREYRLAVRKLAEFCVRFAAEPFCDERRRA